ncbi:hypothetical protein [Desertivirga brevis]|uniref:hypothetical protein n=1 Tax=Desertivirga brevis TaxID=2810310 RepID=UPI001A9799C4|nr:hypothetical protein [Pedobacter sp. SYSU D00873]
MTIKSHLVILLIALITSASTERRTEEVFNADPQKSSIEWVAGKVAGEPKSLPPPLVG